MDYITDGELTQVIENKDMNETDAAHMIYQVLESVKYLQLMGIVHRDLKPQNILVQ